MKDGNIYEIYTFHSGFISKSFPKELEVSLSLQLQKKSFRLLQRGPNSSDFLQQSRYADLEMNPVHPSSTSIKRDK